MPIFLVIAGAVLIIAAIRGTHKELGTLLQEQFTGAGSFTAWAFAFILVALVGTIEQLRPLSRAFMGLMLLVMILRASTRVDLITLLQAQLFGRSIAGVR